MKELITYLARALVSTPEAVEVVDLGDGHYELHVPEEERGKVIGRKGRTAHALRTLLAAAAGDNDPPTLDIVD